MNLRLLFPVLVAGVIVAALVTSPTFAASMGPGSGAGAVTFPLQAPADGVFNYGFAGDTNDGLMKLGTGEVFLQAKGPYSLTLNAENTLGTQASNIVIEPPSLSIGSDEIVIEVFSANGMGLNFSGTNLISISNAQSVGIMPLNFAATGTYVASSPTAFPTCNSANRGMFGYREDTDTTANNPALCLCSRDTGALTYSWKVLSGTGACL